MKCDDHSVPGYDVIGDIHGCADPLESLLDAMGYRHTDGVYRHPSRQAVFVGDLTDPPAGPADAALRRLL